MSFFSANDLKNNPDKSCLVHNSKGQGGTITLENVGGEKLTSLDEGKSEKLLGLHISRDFNWKIHVDKTVAELNKRLGLMRRMRNRLPMVAQSIFNSVIRYGIAVYLKPIYEVEDVKARNLSTEARKLQVIQNTMLRMIYGYTPLRSEVNRPQWCTRKRRSLLL